MVAVGDGVVLDDGGWLPSRLSRLGGGDQVPGAPARLSAEPPLLSGTASVITGPPVAVNGPDVDGDGCDAPAGIGGVTWVLAVGMAAFWPAPVPSGLKVSPDSCSSECPPLNPLSAYGLTCRSAYEMICR